MEPQQNCRKTIQTLLMATSQDAHGQVAGLEPGCGVGQLSTWASAKGNSWGLWLQHPQSTFLSADNVEPSPPPPSPTHSGTGKGAQAGGGGGGVGVVAATAPSLPALQVSAWTLCWHEHP